MMIRIIFRDIRKLLVGFGEILLMIALLAWVISIGGLILIPMTFEEGIPRFMTWVAVAFSATGWIIWGIDYLKKVKDEKKKLYKKRN